MNPLLLNYVLIVEFSLLSITWFCKGDYVQSLYWLGGVLCTIGVTLK